MVENTFVKKKKNKKKNGEDSCSVVLKYIGLTVIRVYIMHLGDQRESLTLSYIVLEDQSQHDIRDKEQH